MTTTAGALFHPQEGHEEEDWLIVFVFGRDYWSNRRLVLEFLLFDWWITLILFCVFLPYALAWRIYQWIWGSKSSDLLFFNLIVLGLLAGAVAAVLVTVVSLFI